MNDLQSVRVEQIMTTPVVSAPTLTTLRDAARLLSARKISCLILVEDGAPAGILTERSIVSAFANGASPEDAAAAHMGKPLVLAGKDETVFAALTRMKELRIRHLPVAHDGGVVGLITQSNVAAFSESFLRDYAKSLAEQVAQQTLALREAGLFKDYMLGMAAHDLRSPMTAILASGDVLSSHYAGSALYTALDPAKTLGIINRQARHVMRLLTDMLNLSNIQRGRICLELDSAAINAVVASRLEVHEIMARKKGIVLTSDLQENLPLLPMDAERIGEVIDNLLSNAVKYSRLGGAVRIRTAALPQGGVLVEVSDTGEGIAEKDLPRLFKEFSKLGHRPTGGEGSTGLGLAIAKKIVELHGGSVSVSSRAGQGSVFGFTLL